MNPYVIVRRDSGAVLTQQPSRFMAVAKAAEVLRAEQANAQPRPPALPRVPHTQDRPAFVRAARDGLHPAALPLHGLHLPAPAAERRVLPESGSAGPARDAGGGARRGSAGPGRGCGAGHAGQADEGLAV